MRKFLFILVVLLFFSNEQAAASVLINEVLPDPAGKDKEGEWIELYNNSSETINLSGWILRDMVGQGRTFIFPDRTQISGFNFLLCPISQTKLSLNNSGDIIELLSADGALQDKIDYPTARQGQSYNRTDNGWQWSETQTAAKNNIIQQTEEKPATSTFQQAKLPNIPASNVPERQSKTTTFFLAIITALLSAVLVLLVRGGGQTS